MFSLGFKVEKSIVIAKAVGDVFATVADFNTWRSWSPWLCQEPESRLEILGSPGSIGHQQAWAGQRIGSGAMQITELDLDNRLGYELNFIKPWKSKSRVAFDFSEARDGTQVTWHMSGTVPIFLFFMRPMMTAMVGSDYERGLTMLKEFIETGQVNAQTEVLGLVERPGFFYMGLKRSCGLNDVGQAMAEDFKFLGQQLDSENLISPDFSFSFYHTYDLVKQACEYTAGYGYLIEPTGQDLERLIKGQVPPHQAIKVSHLGPYIHLGNAWSTAMSCRRSLKVKANKVVPMYEVYISMPGEVDAAEIETEIFLPTR